MPQNTKVVCLKAHKHRFWGSLINGCRTYCKAIKFFINKRQLTIFVVQSAYCILSISKVLQFSIQSKLRMSLFKPFQNLKGSNATIELFLKIGQTFTASQLGLINDLVVKFSNKKLLHQWRAQCVRQKKQFQLSFIYIDLQENPYDYYFEILEAAHSSIAAQGNHKIYKKGNFWNSSQRFCVWLGGRSLWLGVNQTQADKKALITKLCSILNKKQLVAEESAVARKDSLNKQQFVKKLKIDKAMIETSEKRSNQSSIF